MTDCFNHFHNPSIKFDYTVVKTQGSIDFFAQLKKVVSVLRDEFSRYLKLKQSFHLDIPLVHSSKI